MTKTISPFSNWHFQTLMQGITTHHEVAYNKRLKQGVKGKAFYGQSSLLGYSKWKKPWKKKKTTTVGIKTWLAAYFWPWPMVPHAAQAKDHHGAYPAVGSWGGLTTPKEAICAAFSHCVYLQPLHLLGKRSLKYHCQNPYDPMSEAKSSQVYFSHKIPFHCMWPKRDTNEQTKKIVLRKSLPS